MSRIFLMTTLLLFGGCGIFEQFAAGLAGIIRENEDSPLFAYAIDQEPPLVRIAVLTDDNAGLILRATNSLPERSEIVNFTLSPNGRFVGGSFDEIFADVVDFGVFVINTSNAEIELLRTDNTIGLDDEIACRIPDLQSTADRLAQEYVALVFPDLDNSPVNVTGVIGVADDSNNALGFIGWTDLESFTAFYELTTVLDVVIFEPPIRNDYDIGPLPTIEGLLQFRRVADETWDIEGCPGVVPAVVPPVPVRNLTLSSEGRLILDGAELEGALGPGTPMEVRPVTHFSGPVDR